MNQYTKDYYKKYKKFNYPRLADFIIADLKLFFDSKHDKRANLIVDIGCGTGRLTGELKAYTKLAAGIDISLDAVSIADRPDAKVFFIAGGALNLPLKDNICDICICVHVIEHIKDADLFLKEIYRITVIGGKIILITPNRNWAGFCLTSMEDATHIKKFTPNELKKRVKNYFRIEKTTSVSMFTSFSIFNPLLNILFKPDIYLSAIKI